MKRNFALIKQGAFIKLKRYLLRMELGSMTWRKKVEVRSSFIFSHWKASGKNDMDFILWKNPINYQQKAFLAKPSLGCNGYLKMFHILEDFKGGLFNMAPPFSNKYQQQKLHARARAWKLNLYIQNIAYIIYL